VRVVLPAHDAPVPSSHVDIQPSPPPRGEGRTILVVDDEPDVRDLVASQLRFHGYEVVVAQDGVEALGQLEAHDVHLVLTDVRMPRMGGAELVQEVRRKYPACGLVMMSGHDSGDSLEIPTPSLSKPFRRQQLLQVVHDALPRAGKTQRAAPMPSKPMKPGWNSRD